MQVETGGPDGVQQSERDGLQRTAMDLRANLADAQGRCARLLASVREMLLAHVTTPVAASREIAATHGELACHRSR